MAQHSDLVVGGDLVNPAGTGFRDMPAIDVVGMPAPEDGAAPAG